MIQFLNDIQVQSKAQTDAQGTLLGSVTTMPAPSENTLGCTVLYLGSESRYTKNALYTCNSTGPNSYVWEKVLIEAAPPLLAAANMAVVTDGNKKLTPSAKITTTELGYLDGVTSSIQTQLNAKAAKTDVPTKLSQLGNDSGFVTSTVNNLTNYYTKSNTYSKSEVEGLLNAITSFNIEVVKSLPASGVKGTVYLVPKTGSGSDVHDEYIYVNSKWELIGTTAFTLDIQQSTSDIKINGTALQTATTGRPGLMTASQVTSLNGKASTGSLVTGGSFSLSGNKLGLTLARTAGDITIPSIDLPQAEGVSVVQSASGVSINGTSLQAASTSQAGLMTAAQVTALNGKQNAITGAATTITGNNLGANLALVSNASGKVATSAVTATELGYLDGVTSNIQTQLNSKAASATVTALQGTVSNKADASTVITGGEFSVSESNGKVTLGLQLNNGGSGITIPSKEIPSGGASQGTLIISHTIPGATLKVVRDVDSKVFYEGPFNAQTISTGAGSFTITASVSGASQSTNTIVSGPTVFVADEVVVTKTVPEALSSLISVVQVDGVNVGSGAEISLVKSNKVANVKVITSARWDSSHQVSFSTQTSLAESGILELDYSDVYMTQTSNPSFAYPLTGTYEIVVVGGGGGGGAGGGGGWGSGGGTAGGESGGAGGGGGGGTAGATRAVRESHTSGQAVQITIGDGGAGGAIGSDYGKGADGTAGGTTVFGTISCSGGVAGKGGIEGEDHMANNGGDGGDGAGSGGAGGASSMEGRSGSAGGGGGGGGRAPSSMSIFGTTYTGGGGGNGGAGADATRSKTANRGYQGSSGGVGNVPDSWFTKGDAFRGGNGGTGGDSGTYSYTDSWNYRLYGGYAGEGGKGGYSIGLLDGSSYLYPGQGGAGGRGGRGGSCSSYSGAYGHGTGYSGSEGAKGCVAMRVKP